MLNKQIEPPDISWPTCILKIIALALIYFITGKLNFLISQDNLIVTLAVFAPEGFALAAALLFGKRILPGIFLGQLLLAYSTNMPLLPALAISAVNTSEAYLAITLFYGFGFNRSLHHIKDIIGLLSLIILLLQPFSAVFGNLVLLNFSIIEMTELPASLFAWWYGNTTGQFLFTPMLLLIYANWRQIKLKELLLISTFVAIVSYLLFVVISTQSLPLLLSITLPSVILLTAYTSITYASTATTIIAVVAIYASHNSSGSFSSAGNIENIVNINFYTLSHVLLILVIGTLFAERKQAEEKLKSMALFDALTGLPNRNLLNGRLQHAIGIAHRYKKMSAICFLDVDGFKEVNDTLGHDAGDQVLKTITHRTTEFTREEDSLIRLGGDEFVLILTGLQSKKEATRLLERISSSVGLPISIGSNKAVVSLSIGIAMCPDDSDSIPELVKYADQAMYWAKSNGKNRFIFYQEKIEHKQKTKLLYDLLTGLPNQNQLEEKLRCAINAAFRKQKLSAICYINIDNMAQLNDMLGHDAGGKALQTFARRTKLFTREEDALIRLQQDEFILVLTGFKTKEAISRLLQRIINSVNQAIATRTGEALITLSMGVAICPNHADSGLTLANYSKQAMRQAKDSGKNRIVFYQENTVA